MTIDETIEELEKCRAWRGGDGSTPVMVNGYSLDPWVKIDEGKASFTTDEPMASYAEDRIDKLMAQAEDDAELIRSEALNELNGKIDELKRTIQSAHRDILEDLEAIRA